MVSRQISSAFHNQICCARPRVTCTPYWIPPTSYPTTTTKSYSDPTTLDLTTVSELDLNSFHVALSCLVLILQLDSIKLTQLNSEFAFKAQLTT
ncbi:hypothetical protein Syun_014624 [Stephania yunnanensis]|uniref:DUF7796 domain-containing protein n=1 Tax=Stephania yunnanensis TaxID=152371 RepID=A0AAP0P9S9_9MAGN